MGASAVDESVQAFLGAFGQSLAQNTSFRVATSDFAGYSDDRPSAAYVFARAFAKELAERDTPMRMATYTIIHRGRGVRFAMGTAIKPLGKTRESRWFSLIRDSDVVCFLGGSTGIAELYSFAVAADKPALPIPFAGGASRDAWGRHKRLITDAFALSERTARSWSQVKLDECSQETKARLAAEATAALRATVRRRCFIMMPFDTSFDEVYDRVIFPAIALAHFEPIRTDRRAITGDVTAYLRNEIHTCHCGLAVVTGSNPNVMYELGLAHALHKPVLLLRESIDGRNPDTPFDIRNHRVLLYPDKLEGQQIEKCIDEIHDTIRNVTRGISSGELEVSNREHG
jgi:hypothetical protein